MSKGEQSRLAIIDSARAIYNEFGLELRIKDLADKMGVNQSKITNHFNSKELIIQAISLEYNNEYTQLINDQVAKKSFAISSFVDYSSKLMTIQWHYRCAIMYYLNVMVFHEQEKENILQITETRKGPIVFWFKNLIESGDLSSEIMEQDNLEIVIHQLFNLGIHWISSYLRYDFNEPFEVKKVIYLKALFSVMIPFLTIKGKKSYESVDFMAIAKKYQLK